MRQNLLHSTALILALTLSFLLTKSYLAVYEIQLTALIFVVYFFIRKLRFFSLESGFVDSIVYVFVIAMIINSTGGLSSPFFFLYYFLIFALSLLLEPNISIFISVGLIVLYIATMPESTGLLTYLPLFSLPFMTPFALILGGEYQKVLLQHQKIKQLEGIQAKLEKEIAQGEKDNLLFLSLIIKTHLKSIQNVAENFSGKDSADRIQHLIQRTGSLIDRYENPN